MARPTQETLRELLDLFRLPPDDSTRGSDPLGQSVEDGPYRGSRGSLEAQLKEESDRLETERALLERRALLEAVRAVRAPRSPFGRFFRTLMLGAALGTTSTLATLGLLVAPQLDALRHSVVVMPPSSWRDHAEVRPARPSVVVPMTAFAAAPRPLALERSITALSPAVWDLDRRLLRDARLGELTRELRVVPASPDEGIGLRLYGVRRGGIADQLGLENGDTLVAINGVLLDARTLEELEPRDFDRVTRIELALVRRGEPVTFTYLLR